MATNLNQQHRLTSRERYDPSTADLRVGVDPTPPIPESYVSAIESGTITTLNNVEIVPKSPYTPPDGDGLSLTLRPFDPQQPTDVRLNVDDHGPGIIKGNVAGLPGDELQEATVEAIDQSSSTVYRTTTNEHGEYRIFLPEGGTFHVMARVTIDGVEETAASKPDVTVPEFNPP